MLLKFPLQMHTHLTRPGLSRDPHQLSDLAPQNGQPAITLGLSLPDPAPMIKSLLLVTKQLANHWELNLKVICRHQKWYQVLEPTTRLLLQSSIKPLAGELAHRQEVNNRDTRQDKSSLPQEPTTLSLKLL